MVSGRDRVSGRVRVSSRVRVSGRVGVSGSVRGQARFEVRIGLRSGVVRA